MEMEKRDLVLHIILFVSSVLLMILFSYLIFSSSFHNIEERYAMHNTHMVIDEIEDDQVQVLRSSASNLALYAQYEIQGPDFNEFEDTLYNNELLVNHNVESLLIYNTTSKSPLFEYTIDEVPSPTDLETYLVSHPEVFSKCMDTGSISGLVFLPERTLVVAMKCFSSGSGTNGTSMVMVVCHTIDLNKLGITQDGTISIALEDIDPHFEMNGEVPGNIAGEASVGSFEEGSPAGMITLYDIMGHPVKMLKVGTMGQTEAEGIQLISLLAFSLLAISSIELYIHIYLAKNMNYAKFNQLIHGLGKIQKSGDLTSRIEIEGDDEVNWLAGDINNMLTSLEEKEGKYHSLFEQSNDAIIIFGRGASLVDTNSKTSELLEYEKPELFEIDITSLSPEGYSPNLADIYEQTIRDGSVRSEIKLKLSSKREIHAGISSSVIDKEKGTVQVIIRDITETKVYEEALLNAKIEADAANHAKSQFLANMSHELRTPLNSIIGFSDMLLLKSFGDINEKQERYLNNVSSSGKHLLNVINDILDLSKIEAGMMEMNTDDVDVSELVNEVIGNISSLAVRKNLSLKSNIDEQLTIIKADRTKIRQTLLNLLSNAMKFTPENGNVIVDVRKSGKYAIFSVKDTGIGISESDLKSLFHEFTQVDSAHNRKYQGTGLGLALVKKFVEMHDGRVWVESELGKGSCFYFEIPVDGNE
jgi:PAS domain S-box-containing protein